MNESVQLTVELCETHILVHRVDMPLQYDTNLLDHLPSVFECESELTFTHKLIDGEFNMPKDYMETWSAPPRLMSVISEIQLLR